MYMRSTTTILTMADMRSTTTILTMAAHLDRVGLVHLELGELLGRDELAPDELAQIEALDDDVDHEEVDHHTC